MHIVGFALMTLGLGLCSMLNSKTPIEAWLMFQLITASGFSIVISTMLPAVQASLPEETTGMSAGSWAFLCGTGSLFGVAIPGTIFNVRFAQLLLTISSPEARSKLANGQAYYRACDIHKEVRRPGQRRDHQRIYAVAQVRLDRACDTCWCGLRTHVVRKGAQDEEGAEHGIRIKATQGQQYDVQCDDGGAFTSV
jgi:hypothetical protein